MNRRLKNYDMTSTQLQLVRAEAPSRGQSSMPYSLHDKIPLQIIAMVKVGNIAPSDSWGTSTAVARPLIECARQKPGNRSYKPTYNRRHQHDARGLFRLRKCAASRCAFPLRLPTLRRPADRRLNRPSSQTAPRPRPVTRTTSTRNKFYQDRIALFLESSKPGGNHPMERYNCGHTYR